MPTDLRSPVCAATTPRREHEAYTNSPAPPAACKCSHLRAVVVAMQESAHYGLRAKRVFFDLTRRNSMTVTTYIPHENESPNVACMLRQDILLLYGVCFGKVRHPTSPLPPQYFSTLEAAGAAIVVDCRLRGVAWGCSVEGGENRSADPWVPSRGQGMAEYHVGERTTEAAWQVIFGQICDAVRRKIPQHRP